MTDARIPHMQSTLLPQSGKRPVRFTGALLVEAIGRSAGRCASEPLTAVCHLAVYELRGGLIGQLCLSSCGAALPISAVMQAKDPLAMRQWIAEFDPAIGVEVPNTLAAITASTGVNEQALAAAHAAITARLSHMRAAYEEAVFTAFGLKPQDILAA